MNPTPIATTQAVPEPSDASPAEALLRLDAVYHSYRGRRANFDHGEHVVLRDVSLQLRRGEKLGIIGRNGAGKSTLLRLMAGILDPARGSIWRLPGLSCSLLTLGLGFKDDLSGRDNARLSAMLQGFNRRDAERSLAEIQEFSGLGAAFDEPVKTYSAGMRARLGFSTALLNRVDVLLIDEVLAVGDREFRSRAREAVMGRFAGSQTIVLVSHAAEQVEALCNRFVVIENGEARDCGDTLPAGLLA
ncbi:MAG: lipopolysaccharide transport system ATP-binding protein [Halieaceae bacterium]|jgi:lipopolysaccharide transport system ATP-binding protein